MNLREAIGERELHHYTTYTSLEDILKDKYLEMKSYPGTPKGTSQLATVRKSMANKENLSNLSGGTEGGVKIIIDASKLSDTVRGAKVKTVAEFPVAYGSMLRQDFGKKNEKNFNKILKELKSIVEKYPVLLKKVEFRKTTTVHLKDLYGAKPYSAMKTFLKKWDIEQGINLIINTYRRYKAHLSEREGEERITLKRKDRLNTKLPLNKKYIKIELTKPYEARKFYKKKMKEVIVNNQELFVKNEFYKELMKGE